MKTPRGGYATGRRTGSGHRGLGGRGVGDFVELADEFGQAGARDDDRVAAAVRLLGDADEFAALVFAVFDEEVLALDLQVTSQDDIVHSYFVTTWSPSNTANIARVSRATSVNSSKIMPA